MLLHAFILFHMVSYGFMCFHMLSYALECFYTLLHAFKRFYMFLYAFIHFHTLLHAFIGRTVRRRRDAASLSNRLLPAEAGKNKPIFVGLFQKLRTWKVWRICWRSPTSWVTWEMKRNQWMTRLRQEQRSTTWASKVLGLLSGKQYLSLIHIWRCRRRG